MGMTEQRNLHGGSVMDRRPQNVAAFGLIVQTACFGILLGVSLWSQSDAALAAARFVFAGIPIWIASYLVFNQLRRVRAEALEAEELRRTQEAGVSSAIFESDNEALYIEQGRFQWLIRWLLPAATIVVSLYLILGHFLGWRWNLQSAFSTTDLGGVTRTQSPTLIMWFVVGVGFVSFLLARYTLALARLPEWGLLRAGAGSMAGTSVVCLGLALALMAGRTIDWIEPLVAYVIRLGLILWGMELAVNFILDLYRPRTPEAIPRPAFESRLLGLIGEPGGVAKSIADAINYQFGFEVSSTWFYQLLQRWLLPLLVATCLALLLMTSVVVVDADEQVVIERLGRLVERTRQGLSPGIHLKWPFPVDIVYRAPVKRIHEWVVGEATQEDDHDLSKAVVWTESHDYVPELLLLVAAPKLSGLSPREREGDLFAGQRSESVPVSLLMVSVPIEYRIKDIGKYLYVHFDPLKLLEAVAYQYLSDYAAGVDVDQLLGPGREVFNEDLRRLIQRRLDELDAGIEIVFAGVRGAHPPSEKQVASSFQGVIAAQTRGAATVNAAEGEAQRILTAVAGTDARAKLLDQAIHERDTLSKDSAATAEARAEADTRVNDLFAGNPAKGLAPMSGRAAAIVAGAVGTARQWISREEAKRRGFQTDVAAFKAAPRIFAQRKHLEVFEGLDAVRKYLIIGDPSNVIVEYQTTEQGALDRVLSDAVDAERRKRNP
jgi:regulator of protease activity HflC (stomatin/prohibitin superfamily)